MWYAVGERPSPTPPHYHPTDGEEDGDVRRAARTYMSCMTARARGDNKAGMLGVGQISDACIYSCSFQIHCIYRIQWHGVNTLNTYITTRVLRPR